MKKKEAGCLRKNKKASILSQPFIFILILLLIAFTFVFGFKMINNLRNTQENVKYVEFKSELTDAVNMVYNGNKGTTLVFSRDSRNYKPLLVPKGIKEVCFEQNQVYFSPAVFSSFRIEHLKGSDCIKVFSDGFSFTLENIVKNEEVVVLISQNEQ